MAKRRSKEEKMEQKTGGFMNGLMSGSFRPGYDQDVEDDTVRTLARDEGVLLSDEVKFFTPGELKENSLNDYSALPDDEFAELVDDIILKGVIIPCLVKPDNTLIAGQNRRRATIEANKKIQKLTKKEMKRLGLKEKPMAKKIPALMILSELTPDKELDLMKSENERRRGGRWSMEKQRQYIESNFEEEILQDRRGGSRGNQHVGGKAAKSSDEPLATQISRRSRGKISESNAKKLQAEIRKKKAGKTSKPVTNKGPADLVGKDVAKIKEKIEELKSTKAKREIRDFIARELRIKTA